MTANFDQTHNLWKKKKMIMILKEKKSENKHNHWNNKPDIMYL